jgi:hypothetical protein
MMATTSLLSGLCQFVPVPLLDDYLTSRVRRYMIAKILERRGRATPERRLEPLYKDTEGCLTGILWWVVALPLKLILKLLKKLFKTVLIVLTLRDASLHISWTLLMGRTVNRLLKLGELSERGSDGPEDPLRAEALMVRHAFDQAFKGSDLRLLRTALEGVLHGVKGLTRRGARAVRLMFRLIGGDRPREMPERAKPVVSAGVDQLMDLLEQEEILRFMKEFDARFDRIYQELRGQLPPALPAHDDGSGVS